MKYTTEIIINLPRAKVIELFDNPDNMKHWQEGFLSFEPLSGTPGEVGSTALLKYNTGGRPVELIETVTSKNLPDGFSGTYETKGVWNGIENRFMEVGPNQTKWVSDCEVKMSGFMRLIGWFMPGTFKKQSQSFMDQFKDFAEHGASV